MFRATARIALVELLESGLLDIRRMGRSGELHSGEERLDPDDPCDREVEARVAMIADICHGFANVVGRNPRLLVERKARFALKWRWNVSGPSARRWIHARFEELGGGYPALLERLVGAESISTALRV